LSMNNTQDKCYRDHELYARLSKYEFWMKNVLFTRYVISIKGNICRPKKGLSSTKMGKIYKCNRNP